MVWVQISYVVKGKKGVKGSQPPPRCRLYYSLNYVTFHCLFCDVCASNYMRKLKCVHCLMTGEKQRMRFDNIRKMS